MTFREAVEAEGGAWYVFGPHAETYVAGKDFVAQVIQVLCDRNGDDPSEYAANFIPASNLGNRILH